MKKILMLMLIFPLLAGCLTNPNVKKELLLIRNSADADGHKTISGEGEGTRNEKALTRELEWVRMAVNNANPELKLESIPKRFLGITKKELIRRLGSPNDAYRERITGREVYTYSLDSPGKASLFFKSLILPRMKLQKTVMQLVIVEGKVVEVQVGDFKKEVVQGAPGIIKLAPSIGLAAGKFF